MLGCENVPYRQWLLLLALPNMYRIRKQESWCLGMFTTDAATSGHPNARY
jgi:hypothetical protein